VDPRADQPELLHGEVTDRIIGAAIEVHRALGPGLLESAHEACLAHELANRGATVVRQKALPVEYKGAIVDAGSRIDLIVDDAVIVEIKAVDKPAPIHEAQLLTYLRLSGNRVGLLINFNSRRVVDAIVRRVL